MLLVVAFNAVMLVLLEIPLLCLRGDRPNERVDRAPQSTAFRDHACLLALLVIKGLIELLS